jgi:hypothetical protein
MKMAAGEIVLGISHPKGKGCSLGDMPRNILSTVLASTTDFISSLSRYYDDYEQIRDEIKNEIAYQRYPERRGEASKGAKQTGIILIVAGLFMILMIFAVFYPILGNATFLLGIICFPIPLLFIVVGILLYYNRKSGKLLFAVICIVFGITGIVLTIVSFWSGRYVENSGMASIVSAGILIYGLYLFRGAIRY